MTELATIYVFENQDGSKYYQIEELRNMYYNKKIKYDIHFPIEYVLEDINIIKNSSITYEGIQGPGPISCKNCFIYGSRCGTFMGYCINCVMHDNRPGCYCITDSCSGCVSEKCVFKTYLKEAVFEEDEDDRLEEINFECLLKQQEINRRFLNGETDYYIEDTKEKEDMSSLCAVYNYYSDDDTLFLDKDLDLELEELELEEVEKVIPEFIVYMLNKYEMVDMSVVRKRYEEVESQPTNEMAKQKLQEYAELDAKAKEKEEEEESYDPLKLHSLLSKLYQFDSCSVNSCSVNSCSVNSCSVNSCKQEQDNLNEKFLKSSYV